LPGPDGKKNNIKAPQIKVGIASMMKSSFQAGIELLIWTMPYARALCDAR
jgi:hypothetical protein